MNARTAGAILAAAVAVALTGCDRESATDPTSTPTSEETTMTSNGPTDSSTAGTPPTGQDPRAAAEAEAPTTDALLTEVIALFPQGEEAVDIDGGTLACTMGINPSLAYSSRTNLLITDPEENRDRVADSLPREWEPMDSGASTALFFRNSGDYILAMSWQTDPDAVGLSIESPCHG